MACQRICECVRHTVVDGRMPDGWRQVVGMPMIALADCPRCRGTGFCGGELPAEVFSARVEAPHVC